MEALHFALQSLGPVSFDDLPSDIAGRRAYLQDLLKSAHLIAESVPEPPGSKISTSDQEKADNGKRSKAITTSSLNSSSSNVSNTPVISVPPNPSFTALQKGWGKPVNKIDDAKDNPYHIPIYKLGSKDGRGAWFARRSVHEGLPFSTWKTKLQNEFSETVKIRKQTSKMNGLEKGCIRGLGAERRLESIGVPDTDDHDGGDKKELGSIEVYHLSARFPGPASPRDFVTLLITSERALDGDNPGEKQGGKSDAELPRNYIIISKPCEHPDAAPRNGFIRGRYESVEFIQELQSSESEADSGNESSDLVEWIMVTRSDPGGSVPRWMVERGTPPSIVSDTNKFVDWAKKKDMVSNGSGTDLDKGVEMDSRAEPEAGRVEEAASSVRGNEKKIELPSQGEDYDSASSGSDEFEFDGSSKGQGLISSAANLVTAGLETYAPQVVLDRLPKNIHQGQEDKPSLPDDQDIIVGDQDDNTHGRTSSVSSSGTFKSADTHFPEAKVPIQDVALASYLPNPPASSVTDSKGVDSDTVPSEAITPRKGAEDAQIPSHKGLAKLALRRREAESKLAEYRAMNASTEGNENRADVSEKDSERSIEDQLDSKAGIRDPGPADNDDSKKKGEKKRKKEKKEKPADQEKRTRNEAKLTHKINKLQDQENKLAAKIEGQQKKDTEKENRSRTKRENEKMKKEITDLKKEVDELRGERQELVELVSKLQKENTQLILDKGDKGLADKEG